MLLLHGGPGATHEYSRAATAFLPEAGVEYYYYDQLGSHYSDQPDEPELWEIDRFVDEVEQVRVALGLDRENFVLYGQSWGGVLAIEYALAHQEHLKGLVISNMMASIPRVQRVRRERADADHGPGRARRDQAHGGRRARPRTRATRRCCSSTTTSTTSAGCRSRSGPSR